MDQDVEDGCHRDADGVLDLMRDSMRSLDGHQWIDMDMHVDQKAGAHAADEGFLDAIHVGDTGGCRADP